MATVLSKTDSGDGALLRDDSGRYLLDGLPKLLARENMNEFFSLLAAAGADDIFISSDNPLCAKIDGAIHRLTDRQLSRHEIMSLVGEIHQESTPSKLSSEDQDFIYTIPVDATKSWRFRCNGTGKMGILGSMQGVSLTMRVIPGCPPTMDALSVPSGIRDIAFPDSGIVIVTGPTGSGKTTLLASFVYAAATAPKGKHIISYESPPEYDYDLIPGQTGLVETSQVGFGGHLKDYPSAIRNSLRRNPCIILCGESRDKETIQGAIEASMTGHLVFTTAHTNRVAPTIMRLANVFPEGERAKIIDALISSVRGIIHQRLVRKPDGRGRTAVQEWLGLGASHRDKLYQADPRHLTPCIDGFVEEYGRSLGTDLVNKFEQGLVHQDDCMSILQELKHV